MPSLTIADVIKFLTAFAPPSLAEEWDNVGLLVGDRRRPAARVMTCLTITPEVVEEAVRERVELIVTHHPLPFRPLKRLTADVPEGRMLLPLIAAGVAIYSPHTAFDSAEQGINQHLAAGFGLAQIAPLRRLDAGDSSIGVGRHGILAPPITLSQLCERVKSFLQIVQLQFVGAAERAISRVAVACGSAGEFLSTARELGCDCFVTGEARFHACLEAEATGIALILPGHYASERFGVERLADALAAQFPSATIFASRVERDPLIWI